MVLISDPQFARCHAGHSVQLAIILAEPNYLFSNLSEPDMGIKPKPASVSASWSRLLRAWELALALRFAKVSASALWLAASYPCQFRAGSKVWMSGRTGNWKITGYILYIVMLSGPDGRGISRVNVSVSALLNRSAAHWSCSAQWSLRSIHLWFNANPL